MNFLKPAVVALALLTFGITFSNSCSSRTSGDAILKNFPTVTLEEYEVATFDVTAYTLDECGKASTDSAYGVGASGEQVQEWYSVASDSTYPFGTKIYIPYFKDKPNKGIFVVHDRGGSIEGNRLDVYMGSLDEAIDFGRRQLVGYVIYTK